MILINNDNIVLASSTIIERVDAQDEIGLIKVGQEPFYYIGTDDRNSYRIIQNVTAPDSNVYQFINNEFIPYNIISATA